MDLGLPVDAGAALTGFDDRQIREGQRMVGLNRQVVQFYMKQERELVCVTDDKGQVVKLPNGEPKRELVTKNVEMVKIHTPGDKNEVEDRVQEYHRREFWRHYEAFRNGKTLAIGMPLEECDWVPAVLVSDMKYLGCSTREQLADSSDQFCQRIPQGYELREYARQLVAAERANKNPEVAKLLATQDEQAKVIADLQAQISQMGKGGKK